MPKGAGETVRTTPVRPDRSLQVGSRLNCADNSGARVLEITGVMNYKGVKRRVPKAGVSDLVKAVVKKGKPDVRKDVVYAVIIRQKKGYQRLNGMRVKFEDNAGVVVSEEGVPQGTEIQGPVAKEAAEKWVRVGGLARMVY